MDDLAAMYECPLGRHKLGRGDYSGAFFLFGVLVCKWFYSNSCPIDSDESFCMSNSFNSIIINIFD